MVDWAWDASGERLVVLLDGGGGGGRPEGDDRAEVRRPASDPTTTATAAAANPRATSGCLAVFSTATDPLVSARLIGYARPPPPPPTTTALRQRPALRDWRVSTLAAFERGSLFTLSLGSAEHYNLPLIYRGA